MKIRQFKAREILDSRGNPTVEAEIELEDAQKQEEYRHQEPVLVKRKRLNYVIMILRDITVRA